MPGCLRRALLGAAAGCGLAVAALVAPHLLGPALSALALPVLVVLTVCVVGKLLYDTLFFDHYWP